MEEVVAKRANLMAGAIVLLIIGAFMGIGGAIVGISQESLMFLIIGVVIGVVMIGIGIFQIVKEVKSPKVLISYADGKLRFADGFECYPGDITHVLVKLTSNNGITQRTGGIVITACGRKIEYKYVDRVQDVQERLAEIRTEFFNELDRQRAAAEAQPASAEANATDKNDDPFNL